MHLSKLSSSVTLILLLVGTAIVFAGNNQLEDQDVKGKEALYEGAEQDNYLAVFEVPPEEMKCIDVCMRNNQMASVGFSIIADQCESECHLDKNLSLLKSPQKAEYEKGVKALCGISDPQVVQPLITALKRDLKERSGLWANIIPTLGALGDPAATSVLIHTLTLSDDYWLGRDMSAQALGAIGDPSAIPYLINAAWLPETRGTAIKALVNFRDKRTIPVFLSALSPEEDEPIRTDATNGLHLLGDVAVPQMSDMFSNYSSEYPDTEKRLSLCRLLGSSGNDSAIKTLHKSIADPDTVISECVAGFLSQQ